MSAYADTSFLVSLYVLDANSGAASAQMRTTKLPVLLTAFGELEFANAISLRVFRREITPAQAKGAYSLFTKDVESGMFAIMPLPALLFKRASRLARVRTPRLGTRTIDVLHIAAALLLHADALYTFDRRQARLAKAEGLPVVS